jgi:hypothetical protein
LRRYLSESFAAFRDRALTSQRMMLRADGDARMKMPVIVVSASLTVAIVVVAVLLLATQARSETAPLPDGLQMPRAVYVSVPSPRR